MSRATTAYGNLVFPADHNAREDVVARYGSVGNLLDGGTGPRVFDDVYGAPLPTRSLTWTCFTRASALAMVTWLDALKGRLVPFWMPTFAWDLRLYAGSAAGDSILTVSSVPDYPHRMFPQHSRRYLAIAVPGQDLVLTKVTSFFTYTVVHPSDLLFLDAALPFDLPVASTRVSFLTLVRLVDDAYTIRWSRRDLCNVTLQVAELPMEVS